MCLSHGGQTAHAGTFAHSASVFRMDEALVKARPRVAETLAETPRKPTPHVRRELGAFQITLKVPVVRSEHGPVFWSLAVCRQAIEEAHEATSCLQTRSRILLSGVAEWPLNVPDAVDRHVNWNMCMAKQVEIWL